MRPVLFGLALACAGCGATTQCPPAATRCDGTCFNLKTSPLHCGACGHACAAGEVCAAGSCAPTACAASPCGPNEVCEADLCTPLACVGVSCIDGERCAAGLCHPERCGSVACAAGEVCFERVCTEAECAGVSCPMGTQCQLGTCAPAPCFDGAKSGDETDVDCGGSCHPCGVGQGCALASDCVSTLCQLGICASVPGCSDAAQNGRETGIDCGGGACPACGLNQRCDHDSDCASGVCAAPGLCAAGSCNDSSADGSETDVDCGGGACPGCALGQHCVANRDCRSGFCQGGLCGPLLSCANGVEDPGETGVDCGGTGCLPCGEGQGCLTNADCNQLACNQVCQPPGCADGVKNAGESDVDCGGVCTAGCRLGQRCAVSGDCAQGHCSAGGRCTTDGITLSVAPSTTLLVHSGAGLTVTAHVQRDGGPAPAELVVFGTSSNLIDFVALDGGVQGTSASVITDGLGQAAVVVADRDAGGIATVNASAVGDVASVDIKILAPIAISWVSTTCSGSPCTMLGATGSGYHEVAQLTFHVTDGFNPVQGVPVQFSVLNPPLGLMFTANGVTDAQGNVLTSVHSGSVIGSFSVHAQVSPTLAVDSPAMAVVGAKPTNWGFLLQCAQVNVPAWVSATPPLVTSVSCSVALSDRYNNPLVTGAPVNLKSEAGIGPGFDRDGSGDGAGGLHVLHVGAFPPATSRRFRLTRARSSRARETPSPARPSGLRPSTRATVW